MIFCYLLFHICNFGFEFNLSTQEKIPRRLLLFGQEHPEFATQLTLLSKDSIGLKDRDISIEQFSSRGLASTQFNINPKEFTVILIGKDGSEKYRSRSPIELNKLFSIIDSMPMRKEEMKRKSHSKK